MPNKFNEPIYVPKISKLHDTNICTIKFSSSNCNYYERGGVKYPLYASSNDMMCSHTNDMQWYASTCCYLVCWGSMQITIFLFLRNPKFPKDLSTSNAVTVK
jgi:hypothetical protein